jgi:hypothetical protein
MAVQILNISEKSVLQRRIDQSDPRLGPVLVKGSRKLLQEPAHKVYPEPPVMHAARELLQLAVIVLAVAESRVSDDTELRQFLKLGERAIADVGVLMTAHFQRTGSR